MKFTATFSSKFKISVPHAVRRRQGWKAGQELAFIPKGLGVLIVPISARDSLKGIAGGASTHDYRDRRDRV